MCVRRPRVATHLVVSNDGSVVARASGDGATVPGLGFQVADDGTFWHGAERKDVADGECGALAAVQELSGVDAFGGDEGHALNLVAVRILEVDLGERCTTTSIVDYFSHNAADVTVLFSIILVTELGRPLSVGGV